MASGSLLEKKKTFKEAGLSEKEVAEELGYSSVSDFRKAILAERAKQIAAFRAKMEQVNSNNFNSKEQANGSFGVY